MRRSDDYARVSVVVEEIDVEAAPTDSAALSGLDRGNADFALLRGDPSEAAATTTTAVGEGRVVLPVAAFPYVPAYTLPDLPLLAFDLPAIADIYLGRIQARHDTRHTTRHATHGVCLTCARVCVCVCVCDERRSGITRI
jgi:hypothetical protein